MQELFESKGNFQVLRLSEKDARLYSDHLHNLRKLILENEDAYPEIKKWVDRKVIPGIRSIERVGYIGYLDEKPAVSAIMKRGKHTKFCHLKISEKIQDANLGEAFFALMAFEARNGADEVHFTLPESLWATKADFFKSFGFEKAEEADNQYRLFDTELKCSAPFSKVWKASLERLPKILRMFSIDDNSIDNRILLSIKAEHAKKVLSGKKSVEIRRRFSRKWVGQKVCLYATKPKRSLVGEALISKVVVDKPEIVWEKFNKQIGCAKEDYDSYTNKADKIYAIVLKQATSYKRIFTIDEMNGMMKTGLRPPQSYCILNNNKQWSEAVSMGALMQNSFKMKEPIII